MAWIRADYMTAVRKVALVQYISADIARYWNRRRDDRAEPVILTGWFWVAGSREGGPFKSQTAAYRDAWYRLVEKVTPPIVPKAVPSRPNRRSNGARA